MKVIVNKYVPNACVVYLTEGLDPSYIDVHRDTRKPGMSFISVVVQGFVRCRTEMPDAAAPGRIVALMRAWARGGIEECRAAVEADRALFEGVS